MINISHQIGVKTAPDQVISALTSLSGLSNWWTHETSGDGGKDGILKFRFNGQGPDMQVTDVTENRVSWKCIAGPEEWIGTFVVFNVKIENQQTALYFQHKGWNAETPFLHHCSMKWATFLLSLKDYLNTGKGKAFPNDIPIDCT